MTFDEKLAQALSNTAKARAEQMLIVEKEHKFSLAYRLWEYRTLKNLSRNRYDKHWSLRRARHIVTAVIIVASSLLLGITTYAAIAVIGRYSFDTKPDYSKLFIESIYSDKTGIEEYYGLSEENGWRLVNFEDIGEMTLLNYECNEKKVTFSQKVIKDYSGNIHINTENAFVEPISLYNENDGFFINYQGGDSGIYWIYDGYLLSVLGNIAKDEAINLATSTKNIDLEKIL